MLADQFPCVMVEMVQAHRDVEIFVGVPIFQSVLILAVSRPKSGLLRFSAPDTGKFCITTRTVNSTIRLLRLVELYFASITVV